MTLFQRVQECLEPWLAPRERVLCAVSGGPDSIALAHALKGLPYAVVIGHVDHCLRASSQQDAAFVAQTARKWDLPCRVKRVPVRACAAARGQGIEEAARELRYQALLSMARQARCPAIVTAHTADDQAETVLMNFLRGSGPSGLAGIAPMRILAKDARVIRPFLKVARSDVMEYVKQHKLRFRQDPTNRSTIFTRNRIRHRLLPLLELQYPGLKRRLGQMGEIFRDESTFWAEKVALEFDKTVRQNNQMITVDLRQLLGYHRALGRRILRQLLTGISFQDTERVFQLARSRNGHLPIQLSGGPQVERKGQQLIIKKQESKR